MITNSFQSPAFKGTFWVSGQESRKTTKEEDTQFVKTNLTLLLGNALELNKRSDVHEFDRLSGKGDETTGDCTIHIGDMTTISKKEDTVTTSASIGGKLLHEHKFELSDIAKDTADTVISSLKKALELIKAGNTMD